MPSASKASASQKESMEGFEGAWEDLGGYTVGFESHTADAEVSALFKGLPEDRCQCPHWGYVIKGAITFDFGDRKERYEAGDAYYAPPGHLPMFHAGTELVEFSPTDELGKTMEVVMKNLGGAG